MQRHVVVTAEPFPRPTLPGETRHAEVANLDVARGPDIDKLSADSIRGLNRRNIAAGTHQGCVGLGPISIGERVEVTTNDHRLLRTAAGGPTSSIHQYPSRFEACPF